MKITNQKSWYLALFIFVFVLNATGQNTVTTYVPRLPMNDASLLTSAPTSVVSKQVQYLDGLGRLQQTVQVQVSPGANDLVQPYEYDGLGREAKKYLPYTTSSGSPGSYRADALLGSSGYLNSAQKLFYQNPAANIAAIPNPYSQSLFEASPDSRVVEQGAPGNSWAVGNGHTARTAYLLNATAEIQQWQLNGNGANLTGNYPAGTLYVTQGTDENGNPTFIYKDNNNRVICKKVPYLSTYIFTYYIYDTDGNLRYVLPPLPSVPAPVVMPSSFTELDNVFNNFFYAYHYDGKQRLTEKKIPGKGWEYLVYNKLDQVVLSQNPVQNGLGYWVFTKYDANGRVVMTGDLYSSSSRATLQYNADTYGNILWETFTNSTANFGYSNSSFPDLNSSTNNKVLSVNYYDGYGFLNNSSVNTNSSVFTAPSINTDTLLQVPRGMITGSLSCVVGAVSSIYLLGIKYYDTYGRGVESIQQTFIAGAASAGQYDLTQSQYSFTGLVTKNTTQHYTGGAATLTTVNTYNYDLAGRKILTYEQINGGPIVLMSSNTYNELGQLVTKQVGGADPNLALDSQVNGTNPVTFTASNSVVLKPGFNAPVGSNVTIRITPFLQTFNYAYNERGWLRKVNDPSNLGSGAQSSVFAEQIDYDGNTNNYAGAQPQFNGNLSSVSWNTYNKAGSSLPQETEGYVLGYDNLNRMNSSVFKAPSGNDKFNENVYYDELGNIATLTRNAGSGSYLNNLTYDYGTGANRGNQLLSVSDAGSDNYNSAYTYDANGNVYTNSRLGFTITYNELNQPATISFSSGKNISFRYSSGGAKLERTISQGGAVIEDRSFANGVEYVGNAIQFVGTDEGRARPGTANYVYEYRVTDHLGNTRAMFGDENNTGVFDPNNDIIQTTNYYAFGKEINYIEPNPLNQYKYNGKELLTDINAYDYGARYYDPTLARWNSIDALSEKSRSWSLYNYGLNNPLRNIDPDGNFSYDWATNYANTVSYSLSRIQSYEQNVAVGQAQDAYQDEEYMEGKQPYPSVNTQNVALYSGMARQVLEDNIGWMRSYGTGDGGGGLYYALNGGSSSGGFNSGGFANLLLHLTPFGGVVDFVNAAQRGDVGGAVLGAASAAVFFTGEGELNSFGVGGGNAARGGIALGLGTDLDRFSSTIGVENYRQFTTGGFSAQIDQIGAAIQNPQIDIHFNLTGFSRGSYLRYDSTTPLAPGNITNWELNTIYNTPGALDRTTFYRDYNDGNPYSVVPRPFN